jgi:hypothetical protein
MTQPTSDILILGLTSGEHILATVTETGGAYLCFEVLSIISNTDEKTGEMRMGLMPFMPYADPAGGFIVPTMMATVAIPSETLVRHYKTIHGKIITPPEQKIILAQ